MHRVALLLILLLFLLIPDSYIYFLYIRRQTKKTCWRVAYWMPSLLLLIGYFLLLFAVGENAMAHHATAIGRYAVCVFLLVLPKTLFLLCSLVGLPLRWWRPRWSRPFTWAGLLLGAVVFAGVLYGSLVGIGRFQTREVVFSHPRIPAGFDGYRIVQLSDIHIGSWRDNGRPIARLVDKVNALQPDLILFTGDLVNQRSDELTDFRALLSGLHAPDGVYSVLGNHDYGTYYHWGSAQAEAANLRSLLRLQREMGWSLLDNAHVVLHHRGDSIALVGVGNQGRPPFSQHARLAQAAAGTDSLFRILMSHDPTHWRSEVLPKTSIELMLAGHTHAMQLILFGHSPSELLYPEWRGLYTEGAQSLYVNIGIGYVGLPFRLGAWPEITLFTLKSSPPGA
ncbi:MAG: metallophosphoesterase [Prevotellaceae bacterium]|jgi:predicted MPP superfamily phosphohydrolase|nr:metallophosphoesterase [Prevotellaceae bacterium]